MKFLHFILFASCISFSISSCKKEGCTNPEATNYNPEAKNDDGSCVLPTSTNTAPTISSFTASSQTVTPGQSVTITADVADAEGLSSIELMEEIGGSSATVNTLSTSANSYTYSYNYSVPTTVIDGATIKLTLKATDSYSTPESATSEMMLTVDTSGGTVAGAPVISGFTLSQDTASSGDVITVSATFTGDTQLSSYTFTNIDGTSITNSISGTSYNFSETFTVGSYSDGDILSITINVVDQDGLNDTQTKQLVINNANPINTYTAVLMGAQNNASSGGFYDAVTNMTYTLSSANSNQGDIDFVYYHGATNQATLAAPNNQVVDGSMGASGFSWTQAWTVKNATRFINTTIDFDAQTDDSEIAALTGFSDSDFNNLSVGDVIGFELFDGKKGIVKVTDITGTDAGTITFSVKVQQ